MIKSICEVAERLLVEDFGFPKVLSERYARKALDSSRLCKKVESTFMMMGPDNPNIPDMILGFLTAEAVVLMFEDGHISIERVKETLAMNDKKIEEKENSND